MSVESIDRFSGPPLAERAFICQQAQACVVRPGTDTLDDLVVRDVRAEARDNLAWDAWRRTDGRWTVIATVGDAPLSTWVYDPRSRSVQPDDAASHRLASEDVVVPLTASRTAERASTSTITVERPRETAPELAPEPAPEPAEQQGSDIESPDEEQEPEAVPAPSRSKSRKGKRASVPRWDEILFGSGQSDS